MSSWSKGATWCSTGARSSGAPPAVCKRVDVIYRRVDDDFLDPLAFPSDSMLGVAGLLGAYQAGNVGLANALGTGVADDKGIYPFVPDMIRFFLNEEPILDECRDVSPADSVAPAAYPGQPRIAGRQGGRRVGWIRHADRSGLDPGAARRVRPQDRGQPARLHRPAHDLTCRRHPTLIDGRLDGRHIDLRPFVLYGEDIIVMPGGLTRVALPEGSLVVNSSQGGGTKDTWVLHDDAARPPRPSRPYRLSAEDLKCSAGSPKTSSG